MNRFVRCKSVSYDQDTDCWWAWFSYEDDEEPEIEFRMPVNPGDFEVDELYKIKFIQVDEI